MSHKTQYSCVACYISRMSGVIIIKRIFQLLIVLAISILLGNVIYGMYEEFSLASYSEDDLNTPNRLISTQTIQNNNIESLEENNVNLPQEYKGYAVDSKLEIPKIGLNTYVFSEYDDDAMWLCPTKYYGPSPNEPGNYCIAAHNYDKKNMFNKIIKLKEGDTIYLSDNKNGKKQYTVYASYKVEPDNTKPLSQKTTGQKEITLITCSDYSSLRIIIKAFAK